jgi:hypothetical protein
MPFSSTIRNRLVDYVAKGTTPPALVGPIKVSLHTADPGDTGANEVSGGGYSRQPVSFGPTSNGSTSNSADVVFNNMPAVTVTHAGLWDSSSPTPVWLGGAPLTAPKALQNGDTLAFPAGNLTVSVT